MSQESLQNGCREKAILWSVRKLHHLGFWLHLQFPIVFPHTKLIFFWYLQSGLYLHLRFRINLPEFSINHLRINYQNWHHDLGLGWQIGEIFLIAEMQ